MKVKTLLAEVKELDTSALKDGNVLVKVDYSGLNYKDALILNNGWKISKKISSYTRN
jgi:alcohol dehydrogenase/acrylyl-CoA reductase (NADPH)